MTSKPALVADQAPTVKMLLDGEFVDSKTNEWRDVVNPATQEVLAQVPFATDDEIDAAIARRTPRSRPGRTRRSPRARASC